jgi:signal transduction histidine kinase
VFEKFYRGNGEISRQVKGAGVGLSLVRQIVEAHGGTVDFDSRVGEGTVFRIRLKTA